MMLHSPGSEEFPFPYQSDDSKDWSPDSPVTSHSRPQRVHSGTQTEGPQLSSASPEPSRAQPSLLIPVTPTLTSCPSPVPQRKQRHCAKWENRASIALKEPEEDSKPPYESLESVSIRLSLLTDPQHFNVPQLVYITHIFCIFPRTTRSCRKPMRHYVGSWRRRSGRWKY